MNKGIKTLLREANEQITTYSVEEGMALLKNPNVQFVDIRDAPELQRDGMIPNAVHASRGMLEFLADPESPYHDPIFSSGKKLVLYCASGGRSALATQRLQEMGFSAIGHMQGGLKAWKDINGPVETGNGN